MRSAPNALARWRGGRLLHPRGRSFEGQVELWGPFAARVLDGPGRWPATIRVSRGTPTPEGWPDLLGLAMRLHGAGGPVDVLVSSAGRLPLMRHLPLPRRDFAGPYTSIVSYRAGRVRIYLAALPERRLGNSLDTVVAIAGRGDAGWRLAAATATGHWRQFGRIVPGESLPAETDAALAFDPIGNHPSGLWPVGPIQQLRAVTYALSRHARGAADPTRSPASRSS